MGDQELDDFLQDLIAERDRLRGQLTAYESHDNPFQCFHALRFIWTDGIGQQACAACRLIAAEKLEQENEALRARNAELVAALTEAAGVVQAAIVNAEFRREYPGTIENLRRIEEQARKLIA